jgi:hypothetical protein
MAPSAFGERFMLVRLTRKGPLGEFSLDGKEVATSFAKALAQAVSLCGGRPSTF